VKAICDRCQQPLIEIDRYGEWLNFRSHVTFGPTEGAQLYRRCSHKNVSAFEADEDLRAVASCG
jgi:hypothetical protein